VGQGGKPGQAPEEGAAGQLAQAISQRISDGELAPGAELDPARLAPVFGTTREMTALALAKLEEGGMTVRRGDGWIVPVDRVPTHLDMLKRVGPLLRAMTSLAASRIVPSDAAGLLAAYDRIAGLGGDGSPATRAAGYALYMRRLAAASGSAFHRDGTELMLAQTDGALRTYFAAGPGPSGMPRPGDELAWLARALMAGDAAAADAAVVKHLRLIADYLESSGIE
jgi:DNA-binding GntR family transcriptional regulator